MDNFLLSGLGLLTYAVISFKIRRLILPSSIFCVLWGIACVFISLIISGYWTSMALYKRYVFVWMNDYILYFTIMSILGFAFSNFLFHNRSIGFSPNLNERLLSAIIHRYRPIMYINFCMGIIRIIIFLSIFGWNDMGDYRVNAEATMRNLSGIYGLIFRISNYILLLSNFYVCIVGLKHGAYKINYKEMAVTLICFVPVLMSTGGRLWILYIILYYFGSYLIGACLSKRRFLIPKKDFKKIGAILSCLILSIAVIGEFRQAENNDDQKFYDKFSYVTEGVLCSEYCMKFYGGDRSEIKHNIVSTFQQGVSVPYKKFRRHLAQKTNMSSIINSIIVFLYIDFGYYESLFVWLLICFICESVAFGCLNKMTLNKFFCLVVVLKIFYESILDNSVVSNIPTIELVILFAILGPLLFGKKTLRLSSN